MSILEIEPTPEMEQRLTEKAKRCGLEEAEPPKHSIMELEGSGREAWAGVDVQQYNNEMRDEPR